MEVTSVKLQSCRCFFLPADFFTLLYSLFYSSESSLVGWAEGYVWNTPWWANAVSKSKPWIFGVVTLDTPNTLFWEDSSLPLGLLTSRFPKQKSWVLDLAQLWIAVWPWTSVFTFLTSSFFHAHLVLILSLGIWFLVPTRHRVQDDLTGCIVSLRTKVLCSLSVMVRGC